MSSRAEFALAAVLRVAAPLVRLLLRHGVAFPAFAAALKRVFVEQAQAELAARGTTATDSALSLLSGVHRRDIRALTRDPDAAAGFGQRPPSVASELFARWLSDPDCLDAGGRPLALARSGPAPSFDALAARVSHDVRPKALLDELLSLGVVSVAEGKVSLHEWGFAPRQGFRQMLELFCDNVGDHASAAVANLNGDANNLEQAIFVDRLSEASAHSLHRTAVQVWRSAFARLMRQADECGRHDKASLPPQALTRRVRFGVYFHTGDQPDRANPPDPLRSDP